jgi:hypothetical protein
MRNYKDLLVWRKAHALTLSVYKATKALPVEERFGLTSQIRVVGIHRRQLGGGLRAKVRPRDVTVHADCYGLRG